ncbi:MAG: hypothetical protein J6X03_05310, partial [Bacilli bacterium]|nr:hypothetical protein [Bacilli bacterium]
HYLDVANTEGGSATPGVGLTITAASGDNHTVTIEKPAAAGTESVTWSSADTNIATVADGSDGAVVVTGASAGTVDILADYGSRVAVYTVTVV